MPHEEVVVNRTGDSKGLQEEEGEGTPCQQDADSIEPDEGQEGRIIAVDSVVG